MKCPKCGLARSLDDRICRRCKYLFDEDRFLSLAPPRAPVPAAPSRFHDRRFRSFLEFLDRLRKMPGLPPVASLIPGLGHLLQGRRLGATAYFVGVAGLVMISLESFSGVPGRMLYGLAVSIHATCILDTTPWGRSPDVKRRIAGMAAVLTFLLGIYWPVLGRLGLRAVRPETRTQGWDGRILLEDVGAAHVVSMVVLFALSMALACWIRRRFSSREY